MVLCVASGLSFAQTNFPKKKSFQIERSIHPAGVSCIECHKKETPGLFTDWTLSAHAKANITCYDCHHAESTDKDISQKHFTVYREGEEKVPVSGVVTPKDCSRCHPDEVKEYSRSKHSHTLEIIWKLDPWLRKGMNNETERMTGCYVCHGSILKITQGELDPATWPNVGVGRVNLDGSRGSCTSCHTRHRFSLAEARKPEACGQCHLGPDHPQMEIYAESKHGSIYAASGSRWRFDSAPGSWTPGVDYRAPTCASCHLSGSGGVVTTHDVTERLSWELQAPLSVRPSEFKPFPARTDWKKEREKMRQICLQCHSPLWTDNHFKNLDSAVENYNNLYYKPIKAVIDKLYQKKLLNDKRYFDEELEVEFYELWHHEGRRARMGVAMMAPDYAWWHGFYECKKRFNIIMEKVDTILKSGKPAPVYKHFPGATGSTAVPDEVKPEE
ncbi:hydroxylamine oxidoreductase [Candidatus Sumerlaeota bacterium]|nr:hydroxylamine oxidoreductase [Candidatus Sumerlaeota bacterium]